MNSKKIVSQSNAPLELLRNGGRGDLRDLGRFFFDFLLFALSGTLAAASTSTTRTTGEPRENRLMIERHKTSERMSQAVRHAGLIYLSGQVAAEADGDYRSA